jgi:hypothetical protein
VVDLEFFGQQIALCAFARAGTSEDADDGDTLELVSDNPFVREGSGRFRDFPDPLGLIERFD